MAQRYISDTERVLYSCDHVNIITDFEKGEVFCSNCGHVLSERNENYENSPFLIDKINGERTGSRISLAKHDQGLSTVISTVNRDVSGKPLSTKMKRNIKKLRRLDRQSQFFASSDRNFIQAFARLYALKDKLALSDVIIENAAYIYRKTVGRKLGHGRTICAMIAASLYTACRNTSTPRTLKDISAAGNVKRKEIAICYRMISQELGFRVPVVDSVQCIARISSTLQITERTKRHAINILKQAQEHHISSGKNPMGLAAAALYISCTKHGEYKTQREISIVANVTEVTVRNRVKGFKLNQKMKL